MHSIGDAALAVFWFTHQAIIVGGLGAEKFLIPFAISVVLLIISFLRIDRAAKRPLLLMVLCLPAIWLAIGFWGGFFWLDMRDGPIVRNPDWVEYPLVAAPFLFLLAVAVFTWRLRGARVFTLIYSFVNLYFVVAMSFLSGMAVTGSWL